MIIDAHSHGLYAGSLDEVAAAGGDWAKRILKNSSARTREPVPHAYNVRLRLEQLDRHGIDMQVVTPLIPLDSNHLPGDVSAKLDFARILNNAMARFTEDSKGRLIAAGSIPLEGFEHGAGEEMERAFIDLGLKAINVPSNIEGKPLDLPAFEPFWAKAAELGVAVYIHPRSPSGLTDRRYEAEYELSHILGLPFETELALCRLVLSGIMERHPGLKVVSHHLGGGIPFICGRIVETYQPWRLQRALGRLLPEPLFDYFSRFYYDTAVGGSGPAIRCAYEVFGADQILFATDAPFGPEGGDYRLANYPRVIRSLGFPEADNNKIFSGNARKILNLT